MSQRKKKPTIRQNQKVLAAQYRKDFFRKMKYIIDVECGKDIFPLIPSGILSETYLSRSTSLKIVDANDNVSNCYLNDARALLPNILRQQKISLPVSNIEISLSDYFSVIITIAILNSRISKKAFIQKDKVNEALSHFISLIDNNIKQISELLYMSLMVFNWGFNDLSKMLYWFKYDLVVPKFIPAHTENLLRVHGEIPETRSIRCEDGKRPAIRVGWVNDFKGADWISIKPSILGIKNPFANIPIDVFIQMHALNRLVERIDCFWQGISQFNLYCSMLNPKIAYDNNNRLLIEYRFFEKKAGYFRADIIDGVILLRTFLFITNNGTPEGQLLEKTTGLQKLDKQFFNIDKLSTFMNSDLETNTEVKNLFRKSGCECIIELYDEIKSLMGKKDNHFNFNQILSYINMSNTESVEEQSESSIVIEQPVSHSISSLC